MNHQFPIKKSDAMRIPKKAISKMPSVPTYAAPTAFESTGLFFQ
jgi:hypothetical protein